MTARLSLAWAIAVGAVLAFAPLSTVSESGMSSTGGAYSHTYHQSLLDSEGRSILIVLAVPVVLAAIGAFASGRAAYPARLASACLLGAGCVLGMLTIGVFYLPAVGLMIGAAIQAGTSRGRAGTCRPAPPSMR
ncbi:MAG: hypothetical protein JO291_16360 [Acidimicrobiia bacterium]|nr:hypothetical protein [Acidimicrobiia bacterium]